MCIDVKELHDWHVSKLSNHPNFIQVASGYRNIPNNTNNTNTSTSTTVINNIIETVDNTINTNTCDANTNTDTSNNTDIQYMDYDEGEYEQDPCITAILMDTEESKKVRRNKGPKYYCVFRRLTEEEILDKTPLWVNNLFPTI